MSFSSSNPSYRSSIAHGHVPPRSMSSLSSYSTITGQPLSGVLSSPTRESINRANAVLKASDRSRLSERERREKSRARVRSAMYVNLDWQDGRSQDRLDEGESEMLASNALDTNFGRSGSFVAPRKVLRKAQSTPMSLNLVMDQLPPPQESEEISVLLSPRPAPVPDESNVSSRVPLALPHMKLKPRVVNSKQIISSPLPSPLPLLSTKDERSGLPKYLDTENRGLVSKFSMSTEGGSIGRSGKRFLSYRGARRDLEKERDGSLRDHSATARGTIRQMLISQTPKMKKRPSLGNLLRGGDESKEERRASLRYSVDSEDSRKSGIFKAFPTIRTSRPNSGHGSFKNGKHARVVSTSSSLYTDESFASTNDTRYSQGSSSMSYQENSTRENGIESWQQRLDNSTPDNLHGSMNDRSKTWISKMTRAMSSKKKDRTIRGKSREGVVQIAEKVRVGSENSLSGILGVISQEEESLPIQTRVPSRIPISSVFPNNLQVPHKTFRPSDYVTDGENSEIIADFEEQEKSQLDFQGTLRSSTPIEPHIRGTRRLLLAPKVTPTEEKTVPLERKVRPLSAESIASSYASESSGFTGSQGSSSEGDMNYPAFVAHFQKQQDSMSESHNSSSDESQASPSPTGRYHSRDFLSNVPADLDSRLKAGLPMDVSLDGPHRPTSPFQSPSPARFRDLIPSPSASSPEKNEFNLPCASSSSECMSQSDDSGRYNSGRYDSGRYDSGHDSIISRYINGRRKRAMGPEQVIEMDLVSGSDEKTPGITRVCGATSDLANLLSGLREGDTSFTCASRLLKSSKESISTTNSSVRRYRDIDIEIGAAPPLVSTPSNDSLRSTVSDVPEDLKALIQSVDSHISLSAAISSPTSNSVGASTIDYTPEVAELCLGSPIRGSFVDVDDLVEPVDMPASPVGQEITDRIDAFDMICGPTRDIARDMDTMAWDREIERQIEAEQEQLTEELTEEMIQRATQEHTGDRTLEEEMKEILSGSSGEDTNYSGQFRAHVTTVSSALREMLACDTSKSTIRGASGSMASVGAYSHKKVRLSTADYQEMEQLRRRVQESVRESLGIERPMGSDKISDRLELDIEVNLDSAVAHSPPPTRSRPGCIPGQYRKHLSEDFTVSSLGSYASPTPANGMRSSIGRFTVNMNERWKAKYSSDLEEEDEEFTNEFDRPRSPDDLSDVLREIDSESAGNSPSHSPQFHPEENTNFSVVSMAFSSRSMNISELENSPCPVPQGKRIQMLTKPINRKPPPRPVFSFPPNKGASSISEDEKMSATPFEKNFSPLDHFLSRSKKGKQLEDLPEIPSMPSSPATLPDTPPPSSPSSTEGSRKSSLGSVRMSFSIENVTRPPAQHPHIRRKSHFRQPSLAVSITEPTIIEESESAYGSPKAPRYDYLDLSDVVGLDNSPTRPETYSYDLEDISDMDTTVFPAGDIPEMMPQDECEEGPMDHTRQSIFEASFYIPTAEDTEDFHRGQPAHAAAQKWVKFTCEAQIELEESRARWADTEASLEAIADFILPKSTFDVLQFLFDSQERFPNNDKRLFDDLVRRASMIAPPRPPSPPPSPPPPAALMPMVQPTQVERKRIDGDNNEESTEMLPPPIPTRNPLRKNPLTSRSINTLTLSASTSDLSQLDTELKSPFTALPVPVGKKIRTFRAKNSIGPHRLTSPTKTPMKSPSKNVDVKFLGEASSKRRRAQFDAARRKLEGTGGVGEQRSDEGSEEDTGVLEGSGTGSALARFPSAIRPKIRRRTGISLVR